MDYSDINYALYTLKLSKEMFVIGGYFAAGLCEPECAKQLANRHGTTEIFTSSSNFEVLRTHPEASYHKKGTGPANVTEENISFAYGSFGMLIVYRGLPSHWKNKSGYLVIDPLPLKRTLELRNQKLLAAELHDQPYEVRTKDAILTEAEEAFKKDCEAMDWYYSYSDSADVFRQGELQYQELVKRRDALGGKAHDIFLAASTR